MKLTLLGLLFALFIAAVSWLFNPPARELDPSTHPQLDSSVSQSELESEIKEGNTGPRRIKTHGAAPGAPQAESINEAKTDQP